MSSISRKNASSYSALTRCLDPGPATPGPPSRLHSPQVQPPTPEHYGCGHGDPVVSRVSPTHPPKCCCCNPRDKPGTSPPGREALLAKGGVGQETGSYEPTSCHPHRKGNKPDDPAPLLGGCYIAQSAVTKHRRNEQQPKHFFYYQKQLYIHTRGLQPSPESSGCRSPSVTKGPLRDQFRHPGPRKP